MKGQLSFIPGYKYEPPEPKEEAAEKRKYKRPIERFGKGPPGATCSECRHLFEMNQGKRTFFKCIKWIVSGSAATDIRKSGQACGQFERK